MSKSRKTIAEEATIRKYISETIIKIKQIEVEGVKNKQEPYMNIINDVVKWCKESFENSDKKGKYLIWIMKEIKTEMEKQKI